MRGKVTKLHKITFFMSVFLTVWFLSTAAFAGHSVRIGLYYDAVGRTNTVISNAAISNDNGLSPSLQLTEILELPVIYKQVSITANKSNYVQIAAAQDFAAAYQQAREAREKWAYNVYVAYRRDSSQYPFKVWIEGMEAAVRVNYPSAFAVNTDGDFTYLSDSQNSEVGLIVGDRVPLILSPQGTNPTRVAASDQFNRLYEGIFEVRAGAGKLSIVNILEMEQYILGVVPYEVSDSWPIEALKAQAVAARSYAAVNSNKHRVLGFDLCDSPACCQKYAGYSTAHVNTLLAVQETTGLVASYNGSVAQLYYHSNSGGHTENSEDVWSGTLPYLRATPDPFSISQHLLLHLVSRSNNNTEFPARWLRTYTRAEVEVMLAQSNLSVGTVLEIIPVLQSEGGRHLELLVRGTAGENSIVRGATRTLFDLSSSLYDIMPAHRRVHVISAAGEVKEIDVSQALHTATTQGPVPAARFATEVALSGSQRTRSVSKLPVAFAFDGRGWGHGVGMSQWGAYEMARLGYNYEQILKYYFNGISIRPQ